MANNFSQPGKVLDYMNTTDESVSSGQVVVVGALLGVALVSIAPGAIGSVQIDGVFSVPKVVGASIGQGAAVVYKADLQAFAVGAADAGDVSGAAAVAFSAAGADETQVFIKFTGVPGEVSA